MPLLINKFKIFKLSIILGIIGLVVGLGIIFIPTPSLIFPHAPINQPIDLSPSQPLTIIFNRPFSRQIQPTLTPPLQGEWRYATGSYGPFFFNQLKFYPTDIPKGDTEYVVSINRILPLTWLSLKQASKTLFVFSTPPSTSSSSIPKTSPLPTLTPTPTPLNFHENVKLDVPLLKQHYTFTCYSAAAQMVLAYRGIETTELGFLEEIGYDKTPRQFPGNIWGDPAKGIVGNYDGNNGYGVHWGPVATALSRYRQVEVKEAWNLEALLQTVKAGNPVMVWWVNGVWPAKELFWNTSEGAQVRAVNGMHVEVVVGYEGTPQNPIRIFTNDPWRGYRHYQPEVFQSLWHWFNQTAIIVY